MDGGASSPNCAVSALKERLASVDWLVRECLRRDTQIEQLKLRVSELEQKQLSVKDKAQTAEKACQVNMESSTLSSGSQRSTFSSTSSIHLFSEDSKDEIARDNVFSSEEELTSPLKRPMHPPQLMTPLQESSEDEVSQTTFQANSRKSSSAKRSIDPANNKAETTTKQSFREQRQEQKDERRKRKNAENINKTVEESETTHLSMKNDDTKSIESSPQSVTSIAEGQSHEAQSKTFQNCSTTLLPVDAASNHKRNDNTLDSIRRPETQEDFQAKNGKKDSKDIEVERPNQVAPKAQEPPCNEEISKAKEDEKKLAEPNKRDTKTNKELSHKGLFDNDRALMSPHHLVMCLPESSPTQINESALQSPSVTDPSSNSNSNSRLSTQITTVNAIVYNQQNNTVSEDKTLDSEGSNCQNMSSAGMAQEFTESTIIGSSLKGSQSVTPKRKIDANENIKISEEVDSHDKRQRLEVSRENTTRSPTISMISSPHQKMTGSLIQGSFLKYLDREAESKLASRRIEMETRLRRFKGPSSDLAAASNHFKTQLGRLWSTLDGATFANVVRQLTSDYLTDYDKIFFDVVLKAVREEKQELDSNFPQINADRSVPNLSMKQKKIISLLHALAKNGTANENVILNFTNYLFFYIAKNRYLSLSSLKESVSVIRLYLALLRLTEDEVAGRTFVFDIFFFGISRKHVYLSLLIEIWPELMRWQGFTSTSTEELDPLVETVLYMVFNTSPKGFQAEMMIGETRRALGLLGFHSNSIPHAGQLVIKLIKRVVSSEENDNQELMNSVTMSLALLASAQEPSWVDINIQSRLLDHMKQTKGTNAEKTVKITAWVIHTMGMVVKANPHGDRDHLLQLLESLIGMLQRPQPQPLINACLQSLVRIGGHHQVQVAKFLNGWRPQPEQDLLLDTKELLTNFVGTRGHKYCSMTLEIKNRSREKGKKGGRGGNKGRGSSRGKSRGRGGGRGFS